MATPTKKVAGAEKQRTVLQLQPVQFQITLHYMGADRIAQHPKKYRCKYQLERGNAPIAVAPALIASRVRKTDVDDPSVKAATPANKGGDFSNPASDEVFRLMILDNHAQRGADSAMLGRPDGDKTSKPKNYDKLGWMPDISPAVPFRVVVKKLVGGQAVDLTESLRVVVEVKDPVEEFDQNDGQRRVYLQGFFDKFNRKDTVPDPGDDNASKAMAGIRSPSASFTGVKATDVLKKVPYVTPPVSNTGVGTAGSVTFASLGSADHYGTARAKFDVKTVTDAGLKVGVADFVFAPPPVGGDNYRLLLTLRTSDDKDIREKKINGIEAELIDDASQVIPKPRAYTTGRFVIWKKVDFRLVVLVNNTTAASVTWNTITAMYAKVFIEVGAPDAAKHFSLTAAAWRQELGNEFGDPALATPNFSNPANFNAAAYNAGLFPAFLQPQATTTHVESLSRRIITNACGQMAPQINPAPANDTKQQTLDGLFIVLVRLAAPLVNFSAAGAYFGDRMFWFLDQGAANLTTTTCAHELGHALYLRHSHTVTRDGLQYTDAGGTVTAIDLQDSNIAKPASNSADMFEDHDQADAFACLMSYRRHVLSEPCGLCGLTLRFFDRIEIQKRYVRQTLAGLNPSAIAQVTVVGGNWQLNETIANLAVGSSLFLAAVGPQVAFTNRAAQNRQGRANISCSAEHPSTLWSKSGAGDVTIAIEGNVAVKITGRRAGLVTIRYSNRGIAAAATLTVV